MVSKAAEHFPAHSARCDRFYERGEMLMVGTFADPQTDGSMTIFTSGEAAEEFLTEDPFIVNGVVRAWRILEWNEVYGRVHRRFAFARTM